MASIGPPSPFQETTQLTQRGMQTPPGASLDPRARFALLATSTGWTL